MLSQKNVRRVKAGLSIEDLAHDIYRRTLLQSLNVRALVREDGKETGLFEVPAGGRRFRALELLVKTKRMAKDQPVPCVVREGGIAEEDSLAENVMREGLHPLDQFRAFSALIEAGLSEEDIAARFFVSGQTVRQRLRLASVSPTLLEIYGEDGMALEPLMAFSVTDDHARQEQVWSQVNQGQHIPAYQIRRLLTEDAIDARDRRVRFIGLDAYTEVGGYVMRDLFSTEGDGWLQDPALVDGIVNEKLAAVAQEIGAEGWKWVEAAIDLPFGCERGKRRITGTTAPLTDEERARLNALIEEFDAIGEEYGDGSDVPDEVDVRLTEIDAEMTPLVNRPVSYEPEELARAGVFVSLLQDGRLRIDRGYGRVPKLGPPLPGDLGKPILDAQRRGDIAALPPVGTAPSAAPNPAANAARQRAEQEREAARGSRLFLGGGSPGSGGGGLAELSPPAEASAAAPAAAPQFDAGKRQAFLERASDRRTVSVERLTGLSSPAILQAGSVIPAALITGIRSDLPGLVTAQVTQNVYDSPTGRILLIPQGSRLIGDADVAFGQSRILLAWNRLILPDGRSIVLERQPASDPRGFAGLQVGTNYHWASVLKAALVSTLLGVGLELGAGNDGDLTRAIRRGTQDSVNRAGEQIVSRELNVRPTLTIRPGFPVRVLVTRDLVLGDGQ